MLLYQDRLPPDIFCLPFKPNVRGGLEEHYTSWIPHRPKNLKLPKTSFIRSFRRFGTQSYFDQNIGPPGYLIHVPSLAKRSFCVVPTGAGTTAHAEVNILQNLSSLIEVPAELYMCFATLSGHPLLRDTKHYGACFVVFGRKKNELRVKLLCSLRFNQYWQKHTKANTAFPLFCASLVSADVSVMRFLHNKQFATPEEIWLKVYSGLPDRELPYRRPLNVSSLATQVTPLTRLLCASGALVWAALFFFYLEQAFCTLWVMVGFPIILFYGYKYFAADKHWLDSYTKRSQPLAFTFASRVLTLQQRNKDSPMTRSVVGRWLKHSRPHQERWKSCWE